MNKAGMPAAITQTARARNRCRSASWAGEGRRRAGALSAHKLAGPQVRQQPALVAPRAGVGSAHPRVARSADGRSLKVRRDLAILSANGALVRRRLIAAVTDRVGVSLLGVSVASADGADRERSGVGPPASAAERLTVDYLGDSCDLTAGRALSRSLTLGTGRAEPPSEGSTMGHPHLPTARFAGRKNHPCGTLSDQRVAKILGRQWDVCVLAFEQPGHALDRTPQETTCA